ncbi:hypothetical protein GY45DRAFT_353244 [Cubamyces sp. BRFM 1775]|nr:hypothetical protein GY45DRAFT_353244 [Cubamyces sp. BRFM 1775]
MQRYSSRLQTPVSMPSPHPIRQQLLPNRDAITVHGRESRRHARGHCRLEPGVDGPDPGCVRPSTTRPLDPGSLIIYRLHPMYLRSHLKAERNAFSKPEGVEAHKTASSRGNLRYPSWPFPALAVRVVMPAKGWRLRGVGTLDLWTISSRGSAPRSAC